MNIHSRKILNLSFPIWWQKIHVTKDYQEYGKDIVSSSVLESSRYFFAIQFFNLMWIHPPKKKKNLYYMHSTVPEDTKMSKSLCCPQWVLNLFRRLSCDTLGQKSTLWEDPGTWAYWETVGPSVGLECGTHEGRRVWILMCFEWGT